MNLDAHKRLIAVPVLALAVALLVALALSLPASAGAVSFFRGDFPVGTDPTSVAGGNFNGGPPDLAVANEGTDDVSILLGNGFGQFTAAAPVPVGDAPSSIVTGNFNEDSFTDLAVASVGDDNIAIRLGDGTGGFSGTGTVATGTNSDPRAIAVGDFNNDGMPDLISANNGSSTVSIHLGDGLAGFAADPTPKDVSAMSSLPAANPVAIAAIQLGGTVGSPDTNLDALVASQANDQVLMLVNDGTGEITGSGTLYTSMGIPGSDPSGIATGSLNPGSSNPGHAAEPDILIANQGVDQIWPAYGRTDGIFFDFGGVLATGDGPVAVAMGDLDGDGDQDGISANSGAGSATAILSDAVGDTDEDITTAVGTSPRDVETGAFDTDGKADVAVANYGSNSVTVLTSLSPGQPASVPPPGKAAKKKCKKPRKKAKKGASAAGKKKKCKKKKKRK
ncbi:MAG: FG-GAP repeat domain-containing protein [Solirubrobacterales bacterium]